MAGSAREQAFARSNAYLSRSPLSPVGEAMRREDLIVSLALGTILASVSVSVYVDWVLFLLFQIPPIGMLIAAAILGGLFLIRFRVGTFQGAGALHLLDHLAHQFRLKGYRVVEKPG